MKELISESNMSTFECGLKLGELLAPGDFVALVGELGAGKTQFVKGIAQGLCVSSDEPVCSPSYTILNIHQGRIPLYHFDLYRLADARQVSELGFDEYFFGTGAAVVEWADRLGSLLPQDNLTVFFNVESAERRKLCFQPTGSRSSELLRRLAAVLP
ncbi:tRNA threonylcarbamoyladenosine biosynthesis protein TsaE [Geobacter sp. OR-1]|uniref:tRNA (adenosine(37)-N6)-threonylcarbamoyltransferase complex ATPase subunit type 1 TsaE n=1 Tax=Geobacter sp. OR-1 TaxID=1266765 RepID=UPI00054199E9|nr:tRNA (adenosine(37)-N6)-threonylcarbamoyltransferase complex ATPase subunit type 1 TsaE [Geobacter sp. OR-1]GAM10668.1 tRNA threonylcarbamoyladenosine biosynthesis protein TsaE [Geobacter sp. OR-1]